MFECFIIANFYKQYYNNGLEPIYIFGAIKTAAWKLIVFIDLGIELIPLEIKSGETITSNFFDGLSNWNALAETSPANNYVIYAGDASQNRTAGHVVDWKNSGTLIDHIEKLK